ncbi:MAG: hypothetical protein AB7V32_11280 [Candidatus Berkiella sp.]
MKIELEAVTAYVDQTINFLNEYLRYLKTQQNTHNQATDASRILGWINNVAVQNVQGSVTRLKDIKRELPVDFKTWTIGNIISGAPSSPSKNDREQKLIDTAVIKATRYLDRSSEMLKVQVKIAQSRWYSLSKFAREQQINETNALQHECEKIQAGSQHLTAGFKQNKSWFNLEILWGSLIFRIKHICNGLYKRSERDLQKKQTTQKATQELSHLATEFSNLQEPLKLTNTSKRLLECESDSDRPKPDSQHFQHIPPCAKGQLISFCNYMSRNRDKVTKDEVLQSIKPTVFVPKPRSQ